MKAYTYQKYISSFFENSFFSQLSNFYIMTSKITFFFIVLIYCSCETTIDPDLNTAERIIVVDAWINQKMQRQEIRVTRSQPYFENTFPTKISGATVTVEDLSDGTKYNFTEGETSYFWDPIEIPLGIVGHNYSLTVTIGEETFEAYSTLGRVPPIDAIKFKYNKKDLIVNKDYYTVEFEAIEPEGVGDTYWIKAWKNGVFLGKPGELNMAYDASFTAGQSVDGQEFIIPIRKDFINPLDQSPEKDIGIVPPYVVGDSVYVEIHSVNHLAFDFLFGLYFQINRPGGFAEIFSMPLANTITNLKSTNENSTTGIAGFFNVAAVSSKGTRLTQQIADEARQTGE